MGDPDEYGGGPPPDDGPPDGFFGDDGFDDGFGPPGGNWGPPPGNFLFQSRFLISKTRFDLAKIAICNQVTIFRSLNGLKMKDFVEVL